MALDIDHLNKDQLQAHCDQIILHLEHAVNACVYVKNFKKKGDAHEVLLAQKAAKKARERYLETVQALYGDKEYPKLFLEIYQSAIAKPWGIHEQTSSDGSSRHQEFYQIQVSEIIQELNQDVFPEEPESWVFYDKPHLNFNGEVTYDPVGEEKFKIVWLDPATEAFEAQTIYLEIVDHQLVYAYLDEAFHLKKGSISEAESVVLTMSAEEFNQREQGLVYAEIQKSDHQIYLKSAMPISELPEGEEVLHGDLQEQATALIDQLIEAVYAALYQKYLPKNIDVKEVLHTQKEAMRRYQRYMDNLARLYDPHAVPQIYERIYQNAIKFANFNYLDEILRHPIKVGDLMAQLNHDFLLKNKENGLKWLFYHKPYLDFGGNIIHEPIRSGLFQFMDFKKKPNGIRYHLMNPQFEVKPGFLSFKRILRHILDAENLNHNDDSIYVAMTEFKEPAFTIFLRVLAHPIVQIVALALLVIGVALVCTAFAIGVGASLATVGTGILMAGFFAPKKIPEDDDWVPDYFDPDREEGLRAVY